MIDTKKPSRKREGFFIFGKLRSSAEVLYFQTCLLFLTAIQVTSRTQ